MKTPELDELEYDQPASLFDMIDDMGAFKDARDYDAHISTATTSRPDKREIELERENRQADKDEHDRKVHIFLTRMAQTGSF